MVNVYSVEQIRAADQYTIAHEPISSLDLMERAANQAFKWIEQHYLASAKKREFAVFCGSGNNGGDGLVLARLLLEAEQQVKVFEIALGEGSPDYKANLKRYKGEKQSLTAEAHDFELQKDCIVLDCIFGTGLSRKVEGFTAEIIKEINQASAEVISIDIPSGLFAEDNTENEAQLVVKARHTLTFQFPKLAFLFPQNALFVGNWHIIPIGLSAEYIAQTPSTHYLSTQDSVARLLKQTNSFAHKGSNGRALLMAGSEGKMGAAILAARACLRSGVGLLSLQIPEHALAILQSAVPEAMVELDACSTHLSELKRELKLDALGIGPGIGQAEETEKLLKLLIQESTVPMVFDADALNILAANPTYIAFLKPGNILTPHPGEFKRLVGEWKSDFERLNLLKDFAQRHKQIVVLKGRYTAIAIPDGRVYFNSTGNSGMATGGSGDALTGILTSLLAQEYSAEKAAILGVYVHGLAGDLAAEKLGTIGMLPSDLIEALPYAFRLLQESESK